METEVLSEPNDVFQDFPPTMFLMPVSDTLWNLAKEVGHPYLCDCVLTTGDS